MITTTTTEVPTFEQAISLIQANEVNTEKFQVLPVTLFCDFVEIEIEGQGKRQISYESFKDLIDRSLNTTEVNVDINGMLLPSNVFFMSQSKSDLHMTSYYPGGNKDMLYNDKKLNIVTPNIVISNTLKAEGKDWIIKNSIYMCTDLPISKLPKTFIKGPDNSKGLYLLPMSNTYSEGNMCYGGNTMPARFKDNNFRGLDWYFRFLWETPFNDDLGIRAVGDSIRVRDWYTLLSKLAKEGKVFPYRDLRGWRELEGAIPSTKEINKN